MMVVVPRRSVGAMMAAVVVMTARAAQVRIGCLVIGSASKEAVVRPSLLARPVAVVDLEESAREHACSEQKIPQRAKVSVRTTPCADLEDATG